VMAKADAGDNPAAQKVADELYEFTLLDATNYTISGWEDLSPQRAAAHRGDAACSPPARVDAEPVVVQGSDSDTKEISLVFVSPACAK